MGYDFGAIVRTTALVAAFTLGVAACGNDSGEDNPVIGAGTTTPSGADTTTTTMAATTTTIDGGEPIDFFWREGDLVEVVGVAAGESLAIRTAPGDASPVAFTLDPLDQATTTGNHRQLSDNSIWTEVSDGDNTGWAPTQSFLMAGDVTDDTARVYPNIAERPQAETMVQMAEIVAAEYSSDSPASTVTVVDGPTVGDLAEVTVDIIGVGDDSIGGYRVHIFAQPHTGGESFTLRSLEVTTLCSRGASGGLCV